MCLVDSFGSLLINNSLSLHFLSVAIFLLNVFLLIYFLIELVFLRKAKCCHVSHAYLAVVLSMISSLISSAFFTISSVNGPLVNIMCQIAPIIALSFRTFSKTFTWALYIVRGQMVIESLDNPLLSKLAQFAPFLLAIQCVLVTTLIAIFTETDTHNSNDFCAVTFPLWLFICSAMIGELFYGLGFLYIFYIAMTKSMDNVYKSVSRRVADNTKKQIRHHIRVYMIQLISSMLFLLFVSLCICFQTLVFFEAELFISNLCVLMLFRNKYKLFKKAAASSKYCCCYPEHNNTELPCEIPTIRARIYSEQAISFNNNRSCVTTPNTNYFFSNKWRTSQEVVNMKHALKAHTMPESAKENDKVLDIMGVDRHIDDKSQSMDIFTREMARSMSSCTDRRHTDSTIGNNGNKFKHFKFLSMSDAVIPSTIPANEAVTCDIDDIMAKYDASVIAGLHQQSKSATDIMTLNRYGKDKDKYKDKKSQSEYLLDEMDDDDVDKREETGSFMVRVASFMRKFKKPEPTLSVQTDLGNASPFKVDVAPTNSIFAAFDTFDHFSDNVLSLTDPVHENNNKDDIKPKFIQTSSSMPMTAL